MNKQIENVLNELELEFCGCIMYKLGHRCDIHWRIETIRNLIKEEECKSQSRPQT